MYVINDDLRDFDPTEVAEVDLFGSDPETPQHDGVHRYRRLRSYAALRGAVLERRERVREMEGGDQGREREEISVARGCVLLSS
jgi:hypothetical protein